MTTVPPMVYPGSPNVRSTDPIESHEAADRTDVAGSQQEVLRILQGAGRPLGDGEIYRTHILNPGPLDVVWSEARLRTARHELVEAGMVVDAGVGVTRAGRRCRVWAAVSA